MKKSVTEISIKKLYVLIIAAFAACVFLVIAKPEISYARDADPFKLLKIGTKNFTKGANEGYMPYSGPFDGGIEIWMDEYKGKIKKGSRFKIKLKKGYKAYIYYCNDNGKKKKIKNNFKIPSSKRNWWIDLTIQKGKKKSYYWLVFGSS